MIYYYVVVDEFDGVIQKLFALGPGPIHFEKHSILTTFLVTGCRWEIPDIVGGTKRASSYRSPYQQQKGLFMEEQLYQEALDSRG
jgi:hypothetical protein